MSISTNGDNALRELACIVAANGCHSTAVALRRLAHEGYTSLEQVDSTPDWILLAIRGIGMGRLGEVRRLTRSDWQPPSPHAMQAGNWFLSAARFALRYWPLQILSSWIWGSGPTVTNELPVEKRLAMDVFSQAVHRALSYYPPQELIQLLRPTGNGCQPGCVCQDPEPCLDDPLAESDRFSYSPRKRRKIVEHYRAVRDRGLVENKDCWAQSNYNITGRTLLNYEREFPEQLERTG